MAIIYSLSKKKDSLYRNEILIRYKSGKYSARAKSGVFTKSEWYDFVIGNNSESLYKGKKIITDIMQSEQSYHEKQKIHLSEINTLISDELKKTDLDRNNSDWLIDAIDKYYKRGKHTPVVEENQKTFFELYDAFLKSKTIAPSTLEKRKILADALARFEEYRKQELNINLITSSDMQKLENYLRNESKFNEKQPNRSTNTLAVMFKILRSFILWAIKNDYTANDPFKNYKSPSERYGTPFYLSVAERNELYNFDLSGNPELEKQRDIFVFQCLIGCRVGDLIQLTKSSIINNAVEYYAEKTKDKEPERITVPLNSIAAKIVQKYADLEGNRLLPFIPEQMYNDAIKKAFTAAGITRNVTILNPLTRESEIKPLNEIASSHLARRTFIGNLYKKVKDPNLVGKLSGHKEGSKAFFRYRDIDESMKVELVKMLE